MSIASVRSAVASEMTGGCRLEQRAHTIYFALVSLVANLAHEKPNAFLPIHSDIHGIIMMAEKTCEGCVCRKKRYQQKPTVLSSERTHQEAPSSWDPSAFETTSFAFPSLSQYCATAVVVVGVNVRVRT